jgi:hypothetical protein
MQWKKGLRFWQTPGAAQITLAEEQAGGAPAEKRRVGDDILMSSMMAQRIRGKSMKPVKRTSTGGRKTSKIISPLCERRARRKICGKDY